MAIGVDSLVAAVYWQWKPIFTVAGLLQLGAESGVSGKFDF